jgi:hypothetical protein
MERLQGKIYEDIFYRKQKFVFFTVVALAFVVTVVLLLFSVLTLKHSSSSEKLI